MNDPCSYDNETDAARMKFVFFPISDPSKFEVVSNRSPITLYYEVVNWRREIMSRTMVLTRIFFLFLLGAFQPPTGGNLGVLGTSSALRKRGVGELSLRQLVLKPLRPTTSTTLLPKSSGPHQVLAKVFKMLTTIFDLLRKMSPKTRTLTSLFLVTIVFFQRGLVAKGVHLALREVEEWGRTSSSSNGGTIEPFPRYVGGMRHVVEGDPSKSANSEREEELNSFFLRGLISQSVGGLDRIVSVMCKLKSFLIFLSEPLPGLAFLHRSRFAHAGVGDREVAKGLAKLLLESVLDGDQVSENFFLGGDQVSENASENVSDRRKLSDISEKDSENERTERKTLLGSPHGSLIFAKKVCHIDLFSVQVRGDLSSDVEGCEGVGTEIWKEEMEKVSARWLGRRAASKIFCSEITFDSPLKEFLPKERAGTELGAPSGEMLALACEIFELTEGFFLQSPTYCVSSSFHRRATGKFSSQHPRSAKPSKFFSGKSPRVSRLSCRGLFQNLFSILSKTIPASGPLAVLRSP